MQKELHQEYLKQKHQSDGQDDFIGRLLFQLVGGQSYGNKGLSNLNDRQYARHKEMVEKLEKELGIVAEAVKKAIDEKNIDLSEVLEVLGYINVSGKESKKALRVISEQFPEIGKKLDAVADELQKNRPEEISFDGVIDSQKKLGEKLGGILIDLAKEIRGNKFPESMAIDGPVEIAKPSWWKPFEISMEPFKDLVDKIKAHTFSVKVENQFKLDEKFLKNLPDAVAKKLAKVLAEELPKIRIRGGGGSGNPFSFDGNGSVKVTSKGEEEYKLRAEYDESDNPIYMGYAEPNSDTSLDVWQIRNFIYDQRGNPLEINWADGDKLFDNVWDDRAELEYK